MTELLFDTSILVDHLRGVAKATELVENVRNGRTIGYISILTEAELFAGKDSEAERKRALLVELLNLFNKIDVNQSIARVAGEFRRKYNVTLADAIIAATAFIVRCNVATQNIKDFKRIAEINAEKPY